MLARDRVTVRRPVALTTRVTRPNRPRVRRRCRRVGRVAADHGRVGHGRLPGVDGRLLAEGDDAELDEAQEVGVGAPLVEVGQVDLAVLREENSYYM